MSTVSEFAKGIKKRLRERGSYTLIIPGTSGDEFTGGEPADVDWDELNQSIDDFCAEFKAKRAKR